MVVLWRVRKKKGSRETGHSRETGINKEKDSQGDKQLPGDGKGKEKKNR